MYCKECGKEIDNDSKYCSYCGTKQPLKNMPSNSPEIDTRSATSTQNIDISLSFDRPKNKEIIEPVKVEKYDLTYQGDFDATITGIIVVIINLVILLVVRIDDPYDQQVFTAIAALINIIWRIIATVWVVNIAKRQNREHVGWGFFAFFIPNLALIIIGSLKKLLRPSPLSESKDLSSISDEVGNTIENPLENMTELKTYDLDSLKYTIIKVNTKRSFFKAYDIYTIEFFDHKKGDIFSFDSKLYFVTHRDNRTFYYKNKESAIKALYLFLTKNEIFKDDLAYSK